MPAPKGSESFRFEVAFSFAGPHRDKVRAVAEIVSKAIDPGITDRSKGHVFFDEWFEHEILGPNMRVLLQRIYFERSLMVVADVSTDYAERPWTQAEAEAIDALRMTIDTARDETSRLRLINIRLDDGEVPGVLNNAGWIDARSRSAEHISETLIKRRALLFERLDAAAETPLPLLPRKAVLLPHLPQPRISFFHSATNDDRYSWRERELAWLDDCARDTDICIATVTGQGGLGKTSLVGHWIEKHHGWQHRAFRGVFFYSFYSNRDPTGFFDAFLEFVCEARGIHDLPKDIPPHHLAARACRMWTYLVVLDGLEVLQHGEEDSQYGWIADGELTEFVARVGAEGASLLVLTSRFPFPHVTDEHPAAARALELPLFTKAEGADLLAACGLSDPHPTLEGYSELLGGHPLALRIFAGACLEQPFDEPKRIIAHVCSAQDVETMPDPNEAGLSLEESQKRRQRRQFYKLLRWFQQKLSPPKRRLLQLVALFRDPVPTKTLVTLALGLDAMKADFAGCDAARITGLLDQLGGQFLLQKETLRVDDTIHWTAHPIVRDVFREAALAAGGTVAKQFAEIVAGKRDGRTPKTVTEVLPIVESIEVLLAAGNFRAARELYRGRLEDGDAFRWIPAPQEGLRCARAFLEPEERRAALKMALGRTALPHFLNAVAMWASMLGEMDGVERALKESNHFDHEDKAWKIFSIGLQNIAEAQILRGNLRESVVSACEALFYAGVVQDSLTEVATTFISAAGRRTMFPPRPDATLPYDAMEDTKSRAYRAHALSLTGQLAAASRDFTAATAPERQNDQNDEALNEIQWSHHRLRLGETEASRRLIETNRAICERNAWNSDMARCDLRLGELDLLAENPASAEHSIAQCLRVFRNARQGQDLPDALLAMARVRRAVQVPIKDARRGPSPPVESPSALTGDESALSHCEESLRLAARSGFLLKKCDALNLRAQLLRESGKFHKALADAKEARDIATRCDYYWGLHEALRQLRDTSQALNRTDEFREWDKAERDLTEKMKPEIEEALHINREHDAKMERSYGKK